MVSRLGFKSRASDGVGVAMGAMCEGSEKCEGCEGGGGSRGGDGGGIDFAGIGRCGMRERILASAAGRATQDERFSRAGVPCTKLRIPPPFSGRRARGSTAVHGFRPGDPGLHPWLQSCAPPELPGCELIGPERAEFLHSFRAASQGLHPRLQSCAAPERALFTGICSRALARRDRSTVAGCVQDDDDEAGLVALSRSSLHWRVPARRDPWHPVCGISEN